LVVLRAIKQLNEPQPVSVKAGPGGEPGYVRLSVIEGVDVSSRRRRPGGASQKLRSIRSDGQWMRVASVEDCWKINDEWWRGPELEIERLYFDVVLENSQRLTLFHDLLEDKWSRQAE
jgi:hypothetical protein